MYPTVDKPKAPGWYWYRAIKGAWEIVLVYVKDYDKPTKLYVAWNAVPPSPFAVVDVCSGDWCGPIQHPGKESVR